MKQKKEQHANTLNVVTSLLVLQVLKLLIVFSNIINSYNKKFRDNPANVLVVFALCKPLHFVGQWKKIQVLL